MPNHESRQHLELALARRAQADPAFREELRRDPRSAVAREAGADLPEGLTVHVRQDTAAELHLVLPAMPPDEGRLSETDLAGLRGGAAQRADCQWMPYATGRPATS
ncbi:NHLP leader peptide family RiPP precursor [Actinomycetospora cinnamomea]|uniref:Putative ribosomally synthesized peptide n=1 Tax=Actinomycetospora cinnamomea TaxID=663609 RepID=A0A2U1FQW0_9PSEU|nr:NHLP leader peptide family RiPP precursor [Actinomycetospora cinnamomea]PVZ14568.1 putative ribosomally synthesized peptide [Actinomycetospora cinnamomea]